MGGMALNSRKGRVGTVMVGCWVSARETQGLGIENERGDFSGGCWVTLR